MGRLLDWQDANPSYPNFEAFSFGPSSSSSSTSSQKSSSSSSSSSSTYYSAFTYETARPRTSSVFSTTSSAASTSSTSLKSKKRHSVSGASIKRQTYPTGRRGSGFDLFGEDDQLQNAEPKLKWCDVCCKQCTTH